MTDYDERVYEPATSVVLSSLAVLLAIGSAVCSWDASCRISDLERQRSNPADTILRYEIEDRLDAISKEIGSRDEPVSRDFGERLEDAEYRGKVQGELENIRVILGRIEAALMRSGLSRGAN